ncbi:MAG: hypothetical protein OQK69_12715 [Gammaproteobacteria bacterium]|nr:hypothetical protein [Gammaproteobacteria bacterium]
MDWPGYALIAVIVPLVLGALTKSANVPAEVIAGKAWLQYKRPLKVFSILSLVFPLGGVFYLLSGDYKASLCSRIKRQACLALS